MTSVAQVNEITDVLARPKLQKWVDRADAGRMVADICRRAYFVGGMPVPRRSPDPKDDVILATAVAGQAVLLVTGDKRDILSLGRVEDVRICTPVEALRLIPKYRRSS